MPRSARMPSHASAGGTAARTGQRSCNDVAAAMLSPWKGDAGPRLIPSNIYVDGLHQATELGEGAGEAVGCVGVGQALHDDVGRGEAVLQRRGEADHLVPLLEDEVHVDAA